jgi:hypothetical protein
MPGSRLTQPGLRQNPLVLPGYVRFDPRSQPGRGRFALAAMLGRRQLVISPGQADALGSQRVVLVRGSRHATSQDHRHRLRRRRRRRYWFLYRPLDRFPPSSGTPTPSDRSAAVPDAHRATAWPWAQPATFDHQPVGRPVTGRPLRRLGACGLGPGQRRRCRPHLVHRPAAQHLGQELHGPGHPRSAAARRPGTAGDSAIRARRPSWVPGGPTARPGGALCLQ